MTTSPDPPVERRRSPHQACSGQGGDEHGSERTCRCVSDAHRSQRRHGPHGRARCKRIRWIRAQAPLNVTRPPHGRGPRASRLPRAAGRRSHGREVGSHPSDAPSRGGVTRGSGDREHTCGRVRRRPPTRGAPRRRPPMAPTQARQAMSEQATGAGTLPLHGMRVVVFAAEGIRCDQ